MRDLNTMFLAIHIYLNYSYLLLMENRFNWTARKLHKRLQQLGAREIYPRGEADDQHADG